MRILFYITRCPGLGGIENVTNVLANFLCSRGIDVDIYSFSSQYEKELLQKFDERINYYKAIISDIFDADENVGQFKKMLDEKNYDYIIMQDCYAHIEDLLLKCNAFNKVKVIVVEHNTPDCHLKGLREYYMNLFHDVSHIYKIVKFPYALLKCRIRACLRKRKLYTYCFKYILLSSRFINVWEQLTGIKRHDKLMYINNPITITSPGKFIDAKEKICLFAARLVGEKGVYKLLRIWKRVCDVRGGDYRLVICGDGPEKRGMQRVVNKYCIKNVAFEGFQSDMRPYYAKASILCMTSVFEGWPLSLSEAMTYSCLPVCFESFASVNDIITTNKNGYLIRPFDEEAYACTLISLMDNEKKLNALRYAAYESSHRFDINIIGKQWLSLFNENIPI